jgi:hypothetical protein
LSGKHSTSSSIRLVGKLPFREVSFPSTSSSVSSDLHRVCLTRLCSVFRFSQPLDVLFRLRRLGLVSCRIRPWDCGSQRFPPPCSFRDFHREYPFCLRCALLRRVLSLFFRSGSERSFGGSLLRLGSKTVPTKRSVSDIWHKVLCIRKVRSRHSGFTRTVAAEPLSALSPFEDFSPRVSASYRYETSSCGLFLSSG